MGDEFGEAGRCGFAVECWVVCGFWVLWVWFYGTGGGLGWVCVFLVIFFESWDGFVVDCPEVVEEGDESWGD